MTINKAAPHKALSLSLDKGEMLTQVEEACEHLLDALLIDTDDPNAAETAHRMAKMYMEMMSGRTDPMPHMTQFPEPGAAVGDPVYIGPIQVQSMCAHHMLPFTGRCYIAVETAGQVLGLSKYSRIVDHYARRAQMQEELTVQIAEYIKEALEPDGVAIYMACDHMCQRLRGVREPQSEMRTTHYSGTFADQPQRRAEFIACIAL